MPYFTRMIHTDEGSLSFYFNRIHTVQGVRYHVSVLDKSHKAIIFLMEEKGTDNWIIIDSADLPYWIQGIEKKLSEALVAHVHEA